MSEIPSVETLFGLSDISLQDLRLRAMDSASRHLKVAKNEWHAAVMDEATAMAVGYILRWRTELFEQAQKTLDAEPTREFPSVIRKSA